MIHWKSIECEAKNKIDVAEVFKLLCHRALGRDHKEIRDYFELKEDNLYSIAKLCIVTDTIAMQIHKKQLKVFYKDLPPEEQFESRYTNKE